MSGHETLSANPPRPARLARGELGAATRVSFLDRNRSPEEVSGTERAFEVKLGSVGGVEVRPSRLFVWKGEERAESERIVSLADHPVGLDYSRRESTVRVGAVEVRSLGNPVMTLALASALAFRRWIEDPADGDATGPT